MGRPVALIAPVLLSLQLAGCATSALNMAPDRPDAPWTPATNPNGEIVAGERASPEQPPSGNYVLPSNGNLAAGLRTGTPPPL
jgi:hypothetical protein